MTQSEAGRTIRPGTLADVPAITAMYRHNAFPHAQGDPTRAEFYFTVVRAAGGEVLLAVEGGEVVGHLEYLLCDEAPPLGRYGCIETLEVRQDRRRQGIGRALVEEAIRLTRAAGGWRIEVWTGDDNDPARGLYTATGFRPEVRMRDFEVAVPPEAVAEAAGRGPRLSPGERPWVTRRHVAGRQYPAAYCWWRAHLGAGWGLPNGGECGAWHLEGSGAVVLADPWLIHLFLPSEVPPTAPTAWPSWLAACAVRADARRPRVRTAVTVAVAEGWGFLARWPGQVIEDFTLLSRELA